MFERYTEQARRAIFFARFEAIHRCATAVSPVHLLMGMSWEEDSRAVRAVSLKDKLRELRMLLGVSLRPCTDVPYNHKEPDIPLDKDAKTALAHAAREADRDWSEQIDTDHLLRGLLLFENEVAKALGSISLDLETVRESCRRDRREFPSPDTTRRAYSLFAEPIKSATRPLALIALAGLLVALILKCLN